VSEETKNAGSGGEGNGAGMDPMAVALGLAGASREKADAFLDDQRRMLHLQMEEMGGEYHYKLSHMRLRRFSGWVKAAFEASLGLLALALVVGLGFMVRSAAHADGFVIQSFSVPPDLAARGLNGEVVASKLLDDIRAAETLLNSVVQDPAISRSSSNDIKVEIPDTGISLAEVYRFLREWLGHETMVSGEIVRTPEGLAVTVRVAEGGGVSYVGPEAGLGSLIQKAAEHVLEVTVPTRLAGHLANPGSARVAEGRAILERVAADPTQSRRIRASALNSLANIFARLGNGRKALALWRQTRDTDPSFPLGYTNAVSGEQQYGHPEAALALIPGTLLVLERGSSDWLPAAAASTRNAIQLTGAELTGDYSEGIRLARIGAEMTGAGVPGFGPLTALRLAGSFLAAQHDSGARAWLDKIPAPPSRPGAATALAITRLQAEASLENWPAVLAGEAATEKSVRQFAPDQDTKLRFAVQLSPWVALATARTGDLAGAEAVIVSTPVDCYDCVRARGVIAALAKQPARADFWFTRAVHDAPSIPFAYQDWGRALLDRRQPDAAIERFKLANQKGPHFADPLEGWGEALMAKNQSHLALAKFAEANKYAPNWGRLHLKWGEALVYAGKTDEAKKQFARAAQLDLTKSEKSELAGMNHV
jgi:tetratricopeptide (TPR) repeat protein